MIGGGTARVSISCSPTPRGGATKGGGPGTGSPPSSEHVKVTPSSLEWKTNSARPISASMSGPESMNVSGGVRSPLWNSYSIHCSSKVPCGALASTEKLCSPYGTSLYVFGEVQFWSMTPSSQHQNVDPGTSAT